MSDVYRRPAEECCSGCGRVMIVSTWSPGTPGVYCSPKCLDEAIARHRFVLAGNRATHTKGSAR